MKKLLKSVYQALPLKRELFSVMKRVWMPSERIYRHLNFKSPFRVQVTEDASFLINGDNSNITNQIFWEGLYQGWEGMTMKLFVKLCKDAHVIFDVGANAGVYAVVAKSINRAAEIHAFEPSANWHGSLVRNCKMNNLDIHCHRLGVSNTDGMVHLKGVWDSTDASFPVARFDTFIEQNNIRGIDLMKIDVELHEPQAFEGFSKYLPLYKPTMIVEILRDEIGEKLEAQYDFKAMGYLFFNLDDKEGILQKEHLRRSPNKCWNYLICSRETAQKLGIL